VEVVGFDWARSAGAGPIEVNTVSKSAPINRPFEGVILIQSSLDLEVVTHCELDDAGIARAKQPPKCWRDQGVVRIGEIHIVE
jgi:hypothetical protein